MGIVNLVVLIGVMGDAQPGVIYLQELCRHAVDKLLKAAAYLGEPFDKEKPAGVLQTVHTQSKVILKTLSEIKVCGFLFASALHC